MDFGTIFIVLVALAVSFFVIGFFSALGWYFGESMFE